jgi:hypothetical protein
MANTENLLAGIFGQDPLKTKEAFDDLMKDRLQVAIDDYKADYTKNIFTDPTAEDEEPREAPEEGYTESDDDEGELTDEDLAALESLTDEELEALINDSLNDAAAEEDDDAPLEDNEQEDNNG